MERMKDGDIIAFNGVAYKHCTGGTCLQCSLRNTRLCDYLKCFNGEHFEVLKGAEVIEMPSEEEIETSAINAAEAYRKDIVRYMIPTFQRAYEDGYKKGVLEIKSKIVK